MSQIDHRQTAAPSFCVAIVCDSPDEVAAVRRTLASIGTQNAQGQTGIQSASILADRSAHEALRQLRSPSGIQVDLPTGPPRLDADYLCLLRAGGELRPQALAAVAATLVANPGIDLLYGDDAGPLGSDSELQLRPGYSPERLRSQMYLGEFVVLRCAFLAKAELANTISELECVLSSPLPHLTALALAELATAVVHLPAVLYHRSEFDPPPAERQQPRAGSLQRLFDMTGFSATVTEPSSEDGHVASVTRIRPDLHETPTVSIIVPTIGARREVDGRQVRLVNQAISSLVSGTLYPNLELVVVFGASTDEAERDELEASLRNAAGRVSIQFLDDQRPFNFSNACNLGAVASDGEILVFLNDDTKLIDPRWLDRLVLYASRDEIGAVGTRLLYPDERVQHAGIWSRGGHPAHRYEGAAASDAGYLESLLVPQNVIAVSGACLAVARRKFTEVGGFSPVFPSSYNDVDLCLKLLANRWRTVVVPEAAFTHYEASSRDPAIGAWEMEELHDRWRGELNADPYDNPQHTAPLSEELPAPPMTKAELDVAAVVQAARHWPPSMRLVQEVANAAQ